MKRLSLILAAVMALAIVFGVARQTRAASSVLNYFKVAVHGGDNPLVLNGSVQSQSVRLPTKATFSVGTEASNHIDVTIALKDGNSTAIAFPYATEVWLSESSVGNGFVTTAGSSATSATTGSIEELTTGISGLAISDATGALVLRLNQTSATVPTEYLCLKDALGSTWCSGAIAFQ